MKSSARNLAPQRTRIARGLSAALSSRPTSWKSQKVVELAAIGEGLYAVSVRSVGDQIIPSYSIAFPGTAGERCWRLARGYRACRYVISHWTVVSRSLLRSLFLSRMERCAVRAATSRRLRSVSQKGADVRRHCGAATQPYKSTRPVVAA